MKTLVLIVVKVSEVRDNRFIEKPVFSSSGLVLWIQSFRRSVKENLIGPFQAIGFDDTKTEIGMERKN